MRLKVSRRGRVRVGPIWIGLAMIVAVCPFVRAVEHVTLKNGFELDCVRRETVGDKVRLFLQAKESSSSTDLNYLEVSADSIVRIEMVETAPEPILAKNASPTSAIANPAKDPAKNPTR